MTGAELREIVPPNTFVLMRLSDDGQGVVVTWHGVTSEDWEPYKLRPALDRPIDSEVIPAGPVELGRMEIPFDDGAEPWDPARPGDLSLAERLLATGRLWLGALLGDLAEQGMGLVPWAVSIKRRA